MIAGERTVPLVADEQFILATRDTGYTSTAAAIAELIDNSIEAGAQSITIAVSQEESLGLVISVLDDGSGMDEVTLQLALQFGGTARFNSRRGMGRYGMGLPNSSVSQARRVDVYTWLPNQSVLHSYLDVDEIASGRIRGVPNPRPALDQQDKLLGLSRSGTLVRWSRCDRILERRTSTIVRKLLRPLGRTFRYFLWEGVDIRINGEPLLPVDPLFERGVEDLPQAHAYGEPLSYEVAIPGGEGETSTINIRFSALPVSEWRDLPLEVKRQAGIVGGAGVSVVRAGREIAYGWHLMGGKRKENYDDWWRCEISFEPALDELFGVTHSKQGVNPGPLLQEVLGGDLEAVARELNQGVRIAFQAAKSTDASAAVTRAMAMDAFLPLRMHSSEVGIVLHGDGLGYVIEHRPLSTIEFYRVEKHAGKLALILNSNHPFYRRVYEPAVRMPAVRLRLECLLLSLSRADAQIPPAAQRDTRRHRRHWSDALAAFLEG